MRIFFRSLLALSFTFLQNGFLKVLSGIFVFLENSETKI
ncbi:hypothetical protein HMPREF9960_0169 [Streptococcus cristatus ATCC 51100]|uniref:Uncharacterized protein n=1 Tax=Streptococcus cristatus ATCC 51100 TaxID=889201 RepID=A0AAV3EH65_STRCR|nr:hypothetical protein HMPREF9960_0169 [Streptococcus cristatus ATCC 51100]